MTVRICDYGCSKEARYQFKNGKWCCSSNVAKCQKIKLMNTSSIAVYKIPGKERNHLCDYGCGEIAKFGFKNGKKCCRESFSMCQKMRKINSESLCGENNPMYGKPSPKKGKKESDITRRRKSEALKGKKRTPFSKEWISNMSKGQRLTIKKINKRYKLFPIIEELRYNPHKPIEEREIQVHCKNHKCKNSKENGGWFTPTSIQMSERIRSLEKFGNDNAYFYCSQDCKDSCPLYHSKGIDPFRDTEKPYTGPEYQTFRQHVLERDSHECQYCGDPAEHVHHERPQKLEPFFALDPFFAWSCCEKCHYEKGHSGECSTGNLANYSCN